MKLSLSLLMASALCYCSMSLLGRAIALHTDPSDAASFAAEQAEAKGVDWPQHTFRDLGGHNYEATYCPTDDSGRFATLRVKKTGAGWQLASFKQGTDEWRKHAPASR